jgi:hypothetical protein
VGLWPKGQCDFSVFGTLQPSQKTDNLPVKPPVGSTTTLLLTNQ